MTLPSWVLYVQALSPLLAFAGATVAAAVAYWSYRHRRDQDRKAEWWQRTQWALDHAMSDDEPSRTLGASVLALQAASDLQTRSTSV